MSQLIDAQKTEIAQMWKDLTLEQRAAMLHLARLMWMRREIVAEITAILAAAEIGRPLPAPTVH